MVNTKYERKRNNKLRKAFGYMCFTLNGDGCGGIFHASILQVDHILPYWLGGENKIWNLQVLCRECHVKKHQKILLEKRDATK